MMPRACSRRWGTMVNLFALTGGKLAVLCKPAPSKSQPPYHIRKTVNTHSTPRRVRYCSMSTHDAFRNAPLIGVYCKWLGTTIVSKLPFSRGLTIEPSQASYFTVIDGTQDYMCDAGRTAEVLARSNLQRRQT